MKTKIIFFLLLTQSVFSFAQRNISASKEIKDEIASEFNKWLEKSEFETNADYEKRVKNQSDEKLKLITDEIIKSMKKQYLKNTCCNLGSYDAESETVPIYLGYQYCKSLIHDTLYITISKSFISVFYEKFSKPIVDLYLPISLIPIDVAIINDQWKITQAVILFDNFWVSPSPLHQHSDFKFINEKGRFSYEDHGYDKNGNPGKVRFNLINIKTIKNPTDFTKDVYYYDWNISQQPNYNPSSIKPISFTLEDLNITLPTINFQTSQTIQTVKVPDLDINSIKTTNNNPNAFAVVIGNKDYQKTKKVSYSINDAQTIKNYLVNVLGYNEGNIFYIENATKSNFETYFGTKENPQGKLYNNIKQGVSDVFIYYAGHGAPGLKDNKGYFVPVDCDPQYVEQGGYSLDLFYKNLSLLQAKSTIVVTDACFSGADIFKSISPITITISNPIAVANNCVVLTSSTGSQVSSWYDEKNHGLFTYFFLKALQDKEKSDTNKDNKLTFQEIFNYISDKTEGIPYYARKIHNVDQMPTIQGSGVDNVFIEYK